MDQNKQKQMNVDAGHEQLVPKYVNHVQVSHTPEEFVLELFALFPPKGALVDRVAVSPEHAKRILNALTENLKKFEEKFGEIKERNVKFNLGDIESPDNN